MEDADELEIDNEAEEEEPEEDEEEEDAEQEPDVDESQDTASRADKPQADGATETPATNSAPTDAATASPAAETADVAKQSRSASPATAMRLLRPQPGAQTARIYDIVPTMAAPQATSVNAVAATPDMRYWVTGGSDGYVRKYDGAATINGRQLLTVAQRHPFVDSVVKAGVLMSYWENEEPPPPASSAGGGGGSGRAGISEEHVLSPVYSLAIHSQALWLLSGLESGGINLQSVRHDEGKRIHVLRDGGHTNAVSALSLAPDEKSVLSGSWDKLVLDWDLNTGQVIRKFEGSGGQISALELRPTGGAEIPAEAGEVEIKSDTIDTNNDRPIAAGSFMNGINGTGTAGHNPSAGAGDDTSGTFGGMGDPQSSPAHESLFGSPAGSLFGDNDTMGGGGSFGANDDDEFSRAMDLDQHGMDHSEDFTMGEADMANARAFDPDGGPAPPVQNPEAPDAGNENAAKDSLPNGTTDSVLNVTDASHDTFDFAHDTTTLATESLPSQPPTGAAPSSGPEQQSSAPAEAATTTSPHTDPGSPSMVFGSAAPPSQHDPTQSSVNTFFSASMDGTIRIWDRRAPDPVARIGNRRGVPPWCQGACWSPDGNRIYAGRRNGTVEEFSIHHARGAWQPERTLKFPAGSGAVTCVRPMPNGRHLVW